MLIFWIVTLCGLLGRYQCFGGTYCLHLQGQSDVVWKWIVYIWSQGLGYGELTNQSPGMRRRLYRQIGSPHAGNQRGGGAGSGEERKEEWPFKGSEMRVYSG
jgi:hypothetical protein